MASLLQVRKNIERAIVVKAIDTLLAAGYVLGVNDGEETTLDVSRDGKKILEHMFTTDEDYLLVRHTLLDRRHFGWLRFIYGNDGWDVLSDYTTNLESVLTPVNALANALGGDGDGTEVITAYLGTQAASLTITFSDNTDADTCEQMFRTWLDRGLCLRINGADYHVEGKPSTEGISVRTWVDDTSEGTGPVRLIRWEEIEHIHIY